MTKKQFDARLKALLEEAADSKLDPVWVMGLLESCKLAIFSSVREQRIAEMMLSQHGKPFMIKLPPTHEGN